MKDLVLRLKEQGRTILLSSHLLADVQDVCDRIGILARGELRKIGRVRDLLLIKDVFQLRAKGVSPHAAEAIVAAARSAGADVLTADHPTTTLEDLFLRVVRAEAERRSAPHSPGGRQTDHPPHGAGENE
jgi:ABC-2 type transport system ATP-binding protein